MAGLAIDTSSYPKPVQQKSLIDQVKDLGSIQQQQQSIQSGALTIEKQKLDLMTQRYGELIKGLTQLSADPSLDQNKIDDYAKNQLKLKYITPDLYANFMSTLPNTQGMSPEQASQALRTSLQNTMQHVQSMSEAIQSHYGQNQDINQGNQTAIGVRASPMMGGGFKQSGTLYQQPVPGTPVNVNGQAGTIGAGGPPGIQPPPQAQAPAAQPQQRLRNMTGPTGPTVERTDMEAAPSVTSRIDASYPNMIPSAPPPLFEEGKGMFAKDQELATNKLTGVKPALLALDLIPGLRSGPGTETWNKAIAGLKSNGIISTQTKNDPTAIYQEVNKYLHQYLKGRGDRSDADLQAAEASSPNPGTQINPALLKLTQTAVAQDRIEAARAKAFGNRTDFQNYGKFRSTFPAGMDERAFVIDKMTPDQKQDLAKEIKKMKPAEKQRFMNSLKTFDETGVGGE